MRFRKGSLEYNRWHGDPSALSEINKGQGCPQIGENIQKIDLERVLASGSVQPGGGDESIDRRSSWDAVSQPSVEEMIRQS